MVTRKEARVYVAMRARIALRKHGQPLDERRVCMEIEAVMGRVVEKPGDEGMTKEDKQKEKGKIKARVPLAVTAGDVIEAFCNGDEVMYITLSSKFAITDSSYSISTSCEWIVLVTTIRL